MLTPAQRVISIDSLLDRGWNRSFPHVYSFFALSIVIDAVARATIESQRVTDDSLRLNDEARSLNS